MAMDHEKVRATLGRVFAGQDMDDACLRRDVGAIIRILGRHGVTQGQIANLTGIAQGRLSEYKTGKRIPTATSTFEAFADGLGMPGKARHALGLAPANHTSGAHAEHERGMPTDAFDLHLVAEAIGRRGDDVKRRDMLSMAAKIGATTVAVQSEVWEQLTYALTKPAAINEAIVREMEARSAGFHRLEEMMPAQTLFKSLAAHVKELSTLLNGTPNDPKDELRRRLIAVAGESCVLAGWVASDMGSSATARNFYDTAERAAKEVNDLSIIACAYGYRSYIPSGKGNHGRARTLLGSALELLPSSQSPGTTAWLTARYAEESGALGDTTRARQSWAQADEVFSVADPQEDRVWTRFMDENRFDSFRISVYSKTGKLDEAEETARSVIAGLPELDKKRAAIILGDIATAHLIHGSIGEAARLAKEGLVAARDTGSAIWTPRFEVLAQGLRRWQHQPSVRAFLEELATAKRQTA